MAVFLGTIITYLCSRSTDPELLDVPLCEAVAVTSVTAAVLLRLSRGSSVLDRVPMDHIHHSVLGTVSFVDVVVRCCSYFCLCFSPCSFLLDRLFLFSSSSFGIPLPPPSPVQCLLATCPPFCATEPLGLFWKPPRVNTLPVHQNFVRSALFIATSTRGHA